MAPNCRKRPGYQRFLVGADADFVLDITLLEAAYCACAKPEQDIRGIGCVALEIPAQCAIGMRRAHRVRGNAEVVETDSPVAKVAQGRGDGLELAIALRPTRQRGFRDALLMWLKAWHMS